MGGVREWEGEWCGRPRRQCPRGSKMKKYTIIETNKGNSRNVIFYSAEFLLGILNIRLGG
jgi:hypothetical protein